MDPAETSAHYKSSWLIVDVISCFPLELLQIPLGKLAPVTRILKVLRGFQLIRSTNEVSVCESMCGVSE
jgi:hypothetical protein